MPSTLLDPSTLDASVVGRNLRPGTLRDQLGARPTLLIFLRHLGCPFCREWLAEVRKADASDQTFPAPLFFHMGTVEQGDAFFSAFAPDARAVSDPKQRLYQALGIPRAGKLQLLDPRVWACGIRAYRNGHQASRPVGDTFTMPGLFLIEGDQIAWQFIPDHMGELPRVADIPRSVIV